MSNFRKALVFILLAVMGLATTHCRLEQVAGLEFLACCEHEGTAPHQDDDCSRDACATVESGFYKLEDHPASVPEPVLLSSFLLPRPEPTPANSLPGSQSLSQAPPELLWTWQFSFRTALPPRAPSFLS